MSSASFRNLRHECTAIALSCEMDGPTRVHCVGCCHAGTAFPDDFQSTVRTLGDTKMLDLLDGMSGACVHWSVLQEMSISSWWFSGHIRQCLLEHPCGRGNTAISDA